MAHFIQELYLRRLAVFRRSISISILVAFVLTSIKAPAYGSTTLTTGVQATDPMPRMPAPGMMVHLSPEYTPAYLKGIVIHPEDALKFDFIVYRGDTPLTDAQKRQEYTKLAKYFLASLAIPDDDQWVNLSPYEKDRIIKDDFGKTEMGRDLLAQDYLLKQITASLIYPEDHLGKEFWNRVYVQAQEQYGTTSIPVNTFNKVWIVPDNALIYEKGHTAYVLKNHLKVMLEEDYLSLQKHAGIQSVPAENKAHTIASKIIKEIVLPELEREVNEGKNFAALRQVFSGMVLAAWYKQALKESLLAKIYADKAKVKGVDQDPRTNEEIYRQYLKAYKKGVFNFIKEDVDKYTNETIPRKYFSGGVQNIYLKGSLHTEETASPAQVTEMREEAKTNDDLASIALAESNADGAMIGGRTGELLTGKNARIEKEIAPHRAKEQALREAGKKALLERASANPTEMPITAINGKGNANSAMRTEEADGKSIGAPTRDDKMTGWQKKFLLPLETTDRKVPVYSQYNPADGYTYHYTPGMRQKWLVEGKEGEGYIVHSFMIREQEKGDQTGRSAYEIIQMYEQHKFMDPSLKRIDSRSISDYLRNIKTNPIIQDLLEQKKVRPELERQKLLKMATILTDFGHVDRTTLPILSDRLNKLLVLLGHSTSITEDERRKLMVAITNILDLENVIKSKLPEGKTFTNKEALGPEFLSPHISIYDMLKERLLSIGWVHVENKLQDVNNQIEGTNGHAEIPLDIVPEEQRNDKGNLKNWIKEQIAFYAVGDLAVDIVGLKLDENTQRYKVEFKVKDAAMRHSEPKNLNNNQAMRNGGIDLNAANLNLQIKRDGRGVPLPMSRQNIDSIHLNGLIPVVLSIQPAAKTQFLSELQVV